MAAATESVYFGNMCTMTVANSTGTPAALTLAIGKDIEITEGWEHVEAYGWGTTIRAGVAKHSRKVTVKIGWLKFAPKLAEWFPFWIKDSAAGSGTAADVNTVTLFTITGQFTPFDSTGTVKLLRTVTNVYFPNFPMKATEGQFVKVDLEGYGSTVVDSNPA